MGIDPLQPATAADITPLTLNIAGISLEAVDLSSIRFGAAATRTPASHEGKQH